MTCRDLFGNETEQRGPKGKHQKHDYPDRRREYPQLGVQTEAEDYSKERRLLEQYRPKHRGECASAREAIGTDGCPWVSCRHNLLADIDDGMERNMDLVELDAELLNGKPITRKWTCVLDFVDAVNAGRFVADETEQDDDEPTIAPITELVSDQSVGDALGLSREWVRQTIDGALKKIRPAMARLDGRVLKR